MKRAQRKALGRFIVADPRICRGRPTFKGTRVTVADVLGDVERGLSWEFICYRWGDGKITKAAVAEAVRLARRALPVPRTEWHWFWLSRSLSSSY